MIERTGFFEESPGVRSMTRLAIAWMCALATIVVLSLCWYLLRGNPSAEIVMAINAALATIVVKAVVAIWKRNGGDDAKDGAA